MLNIHRTLFFFLMTVFISAFGIQESIARQQMFDPFYLNVEGKGVDYLVKDLNEDGLNDFLFFFFKESDAGPIRYFSIFFQTKNGFNKTADQSFKLDQSAIVFDLADVSPPKGLEILFINDSGIFYYEQTNLHYGVTPKKLLDIDSMFKLSDKTFFRNFNFALDLNSDGIDEILIPQFKSYVIYSKGLNGDFDFQSRLSISLKSSVARRESLALLKEIDRNFFVAAYGTPSVIFSDYNGDTLTDIISVDESNLIIFFQDKMGNYSDENSTTVALGFKVTKEFSVLMENMINAYIRQEMEDQLRIQYIKDINNDGLIDIVVEKSSLKAGFLKPEQHFLFFFGKKNDDDPSKGGIFNKAPDQIIFNPGLVGDHCLKDINYDGKLDMILAVTEFGILKIISTLVTGKVSLKTNFYILNDDSRYPEKANYIKKTRFKFDINDHNAFPVMGFDGDFNGDDKLNIIFSFDNTELLIGSGTKLFGKKTPRYQSQGDILKLSTRVQIEVPKHGNKVKSKKVNNDSKSDVVMIYPFREKNNVCILIAK
jgi:hypothetical protein